MGERFGLRTGDCDSTDHLMLLRWLGLDEQREKEMCMCE